MNIDIIEGCRGTGKSTVSAKIRQNISEVTLVNPTGFHLDGEEGFVKINNYYDKWMDMLHSMYNQDFNFLFDRFYFSEAVFSKLYKNYNFSESLTYLNAELDFLSKKGVNIDIFFLTIEDEEELSNRLNREKVAFGKAEESVKQSLIQQAEYFKVFDDFKKFHLKPNLRIHTIKTDGKTNDEVYIEILNLKATL